MEHKCYLTFVVMIGTRCSSMSMSASASILSRYTYVHIHLQYVVCRAMSECLHGFVHYGESKCMRHSVKVLQQKSNLKLDRIRSMWRTSRWWHQACPSLRFTRACMQSMWTSLHWDCHKWPNKYGGLAVVAKISFSAHDRETFGN